MGNASLLIIKELINKISNYDCKNKNCRDCFFNFIVPVHYLLDYDLDNVKYTNCLVTLIEENIKGDE